MQRFSVFVLYVARGHRGPSTVGPLRIFEELIGDLHEVVPAVLDCQTVGEEVALVQRVGFELAVLVVLNGPRSIAYVVPCWMESSRTMQPPT